MQNTPLRVQTLSSPKECVLPKYRAVCQRKGLSVRAVLLGTGDSPAVLYPQCALCLVTSQFEGWQVLLCILHDWMEICLTFRRITLFFSLTSKFRASRWVKCRPRLLVSASSCLRAMGHTQVLRPWVQGQQTPWKGGRKAACLGPTQAYPIGRNLARCPPWATPTSWAPPSRFSRGFLCLQAPRTRPQGHLHFRPETANPNSH